MDAENVAICSICFEEIKDEYVTECNHKFCVKCITEWFKIKHTCPYCNKRFSNEVDFDDFLYIIQNIIVQNFLSEDSIPVILIERVENQIFNINFQRI
jgi:hypothetical protein